MGTNYNTRIPTAGLVLCLDASNPKSYPGTGNTWYDLSGFGRHATKAGSQSPTYPQYNSNGYFTFTGGAMGDPYSYFYCTTPTVSAITVITVHYSTGSGNCVLRHSSDSFQIGSSGYAAGTAYNNINCGPDVSATTNVWQHNIMTFTGTVVTGYKNGVYVATNSRTSTTVAGGQLNIGTRSDAYWEHYVGRIALVLMYDRVLTSNEINLHFNATRGRYGL